MYPPMPLSRRAWAFMMRSMFADQPYSPVTRQHGESTTRLDRMHFSTLSPSVSFTILHIFSYAATFSSHAAFSSSVSSNLTPSLVSDTSFLPAYSSMGSTMYSTSKLRFLHSSRKGELETASLL